MRLRTYLAILAFVCCLGGLLLEFVIFQRQQEVDVSAAKIESALKQQQDIHRLSDHLSQLFLFIDLLFGASETYMIDVTHQQLSLSITLAQSLTESALNSNDAVLRLNRIVERLNLLAEEVDLVSVRAANPEFSIALEQLDRVDRVSIELTTELQRLDAIGGDLTERSRLQHAELREFFDAASWLAGAIYIVIVFLVFVWVARVVARPLNNVALAADIALREHLPFDAPIEGPTEIRSLAGNISTLIQSLEQAIESRTRFLASMSHELRTPLNGVLGMTAVLLDSDLRPQDRKCMQLIQSSGESLHFIINELLDFARYEDGSIELEVNDFSLEDLVSEVLDVTTPLTNQKNIVLYLDMPLFDSNQYVGDKNRLRQVLLNLLSNAIKFTHEGSVTLRIGIPKTTQGVSDIRFDVVDTGIGVPKDKLETIFDPFSQSDASITRKYGGTGLGLAICTEIIALMGSKIIVKSEINKGSTFTFRVQLPLAKEKSAANDYPGLPQEISLVFVDDLKRTQAERVLKKAKIKTHSFKTLDGMDLKGANRSMLIEVTDTNAATINRYAAANTGNSIHAIGYSGLLLDVDETLVNVVSDPSGPRDLLNALSSKRLVDSNPAERSEYHLNILLADDNPVNRMIASKMIKRVGSRVTQVGDGQEAVNACASDSYDAVFMDVQMPKMDGLTATRIIRTEQVHQPVIIAMTANVMSEDQQACFDIGMDDFLAKPLRIDEFDAILDKIAAGNHYVSSSPTQPIS